MGAGRAKHALRGRPGAKRKWPQLRAGHFLMHLAAPPRARGRGYWTGVPRPTCAPPPPLVPGAPHQADDPALWDERLCSRFALSVIRGPCKLHARARTCGASSRAAAEFFPSREAFDLYAAQGLGARHVGRLCQKHLVPRQGRSS